MKKILTLGGALACLVGIPAANAQIVIQPTIVTSAPAYITPVYAPPPAVVVAEPAYPVHIDHHHYDKRYWAYWNHRDDRR